MGELEKLPLKRVELSLSKFNEVAIPHHLDLMRQHRANIIKYEEKGDYSRVRNEQIHARRVTSQLRSLLSELEALRRRVVDQDLVKFDAITQKSRDLTLKAIMDYLDTSPLAINRQPVADTVASSVRSTDSVGIIPDDQQLQLIVDEEDVRLREREALLAGWAGLQTEVRQLHEAWGAVHSAALLQREHVEVTSERVEQTADNVQVARLHLASAERLRASGLGAGGAVVGALVGGPVGLVVGAKIGAAAALAGSVLGYLGASLIGRRRQGQIDTAIEGETKRADEKKTE